MLDNLIVYGTNFTDFPELSHNIGYFWTICGVVTLVVVSSSSIVAVYGGSILQHFCNQTGVANTNDPSPRAFTSQVLLFSLEWVKGQVQASQIEKRLKRREPISISSGRRSHEGHTTCCY